MQQANQRIKTENFLRLKQFITLLLKQFAASISFFEWKTRKMMTSSPITVIARRQQRDLLKRAALIF